MKETNKSIIERNYSDHQSTMKNIRIDMDEIKEEMRKEIVGLSQTITFHMIRGEVTEASNVRLLLNERIDILLKMYR